MCRDFNGYHSGGSSFVYVNDFWLLQNYLYTHRYKLSSEKKKKKKSKESKYMVSHPETGSDSPIGSDWESGRDMSLGTHSVDFGCVSGPRESRGSYELGETKVSFRDT